MNCLLRHPHPSIMEADYCNWLQAKKQNGEIYDFVWQRSFKVSKTKDWKPDFTILNRRGKVVEVHESKGWNRSDDNFRFKLALFFECYPKIPVFVNGLPVHPSPSGKRIIGLEKKYRARARWRRLERYDRLPQTKRLFLQG